MTVCVWGGTTTLAKQIDCLVAQHPAVLRLDELPVELQRDAHMHHLGSPLTYDIEPRNFAAEAAAKREMDAEIKAKEAAREAMQLERRKTATWGDGTPIYPEAYGHRS